MLAMPVLGAIHRGIETTFQAASRENNVSFWSMFLGSGYFPVQSCASRAIEMKVQLSNRSLDFPTSPPNLLRPIPIPKAFVPHKPQKHFWPAVPDLRQLRALLANDVHEDILEGCDRLGRSAHRKSQRALKRERKMCRRKCPLSSCFTTPSPNQVCECACDKWACFVGR